MKSEYPIGVRLYVAVRNEIDKFCKYAGLDYIISDSSSVVVQTTDIITMCISLGSYIAENNSSDFESHALLSNLLHFHIVSFDKGIFYVTFYKLND